ncbi:MAG: hypothetical protein V1891_02000 [bacterium]
MAICLTTLCFCGNTYAVKTHDISTGWSLADIRTRIEQNQLSQIPATLGFGAHLWHNAKCIEFFEKWTGKILSNAEKKYILLGGVSADYGIMGSSRDDSYNNVLWHEPLKEDEWYNLIDAQGAKCTSHFFNGFKYDENGIRDKSKERLTDFAGSENWHHVSLVYLTHLKFLAKIMLEILDELILWKNQQRKK